MGDDPRFQRLEAVARPHFSDSDSAHDKGHALRVLRLAEHICEREGGDVTIVRPAALLHDIGCAPKHLGRDADSEERTLEISRGLLGEAGYTDEEAERILRIISIHGYSRGIVPESLEGRILQDADRLDAMGAVGIARTFLVSGSTNRPIYHPDDPWAEDRDLDDKAWGLDHFFRKLLKLKEGMHTATGRKMAEERHRFLEAYLKELRRELK